MGSLSDVLGIRQRDPEPIPDPPAPELEPDTASLSIQRRARDRRRLERDMLRVSDPATVAPSETGLGLRR